MPRGAAPGERRGGRKAGTSNKLTVGKAYSRHVRINTLDGALQHLTAVIAALVPDPQDRAMLGEAIDGYIACRERAAQNQRRARSVVEGVPAPRWFTQLQVPATIELETYDLGIDIAALNDAMRDRGLTGDALIDVVRSFLPGKAK
jgi:hypothetical protein